MGWKAKTRFEIREAFKEEADVEKESKENRKSEIDKERRFLKESSGGKICRAVLESNSSLFFSSFPFFFVFIGIKFCCVVAESKGSLLFSLYSIFSLSISPLFSRMVPNYLSFIFFPIPSFPCFAFLFFSILYFS